MVSGNKIRRALTYAGVNAIAQEIVLEKPRTAPKLYLPFSSICWEGISLLEHRDTTGEAMRGPNPENSNYRRCKRQVFR